MMSRKTVAMSIKNQVCISPVFVGSEILLTLNSDYWYLGDTEDGDDKSPLAFKTVGNEVYETWNVGGQRVVKRFKISKQITTSTSDEESSDDEEAAAKRVNAAWETQQDQGK